jgi:predicted enzyme related to lactoylglutathione lyase
MKTEFRLSIGQFLLTGLLFAVCGGALTLTAGSLRLPSAHASEVQPLFGAGQAGEKTAKEKSGAPVVHFDIGCKDIVKTNEFYSKLFDWKIKRQGLAGFIDTGSKEGIQGHITSLGHEPEHYVTFYVEVSDIGSYLEKSKQLGGKTLVPAVKIPTGQFAWISDPDGNIVGLMQPKPEPK